MAGHNPFEKAVEIVKTLITAYFKLKADLEIPIATSDRSGLNLHKDRRTLRARKHSAWDNEHDLVISIYDVLAIVFNSRISFRESPLIFPCSIWVSNGFT